MDTTKEKRRQNDKQRLQCRDEGVIMALSKRKINSIIADAKAKRYETVTALCKHHKISSKTYYNLEKRHTFKFGDNIDIVEASVIIEREKSKLKNTQEIHSIEQAVKERICTIDIDNELIDNNRKILKALQGKAIGMLSTTTDPKEVKSLTSSIVDIERVANPRRDSVQVNTQVNTQVKNEQVVFYIPDNGRV